METTNKTHIQKHTHKSRNCDLYMYTSLLKCGNEAYGIGRGIGALGVFCSSTDCCLTLIAFDSQLRFWSLYV